MKAIVFWLGAALVFGTFAFLVGRKEQTVAKGRTVLLELAPRDPRSWMQGDYMQLRYSAAASAEREDLPPAGHLVLALDDRDCGTFVRVDRGEPLQEGELRLRYRRRGGVWLGAESFFFEEGQAPTYEPARYGELRVDAAGGSVLIGLRDGDRRFLGARVFD